MGKIQAYTISAEEFHRLTEVDAKYTALTNLIEKNNPVFVTVSMIANSFGLSRQEVTSRPWLMPNFGRCERTDENRKKRFWHFEEYLDWVAIPEYERIMMYRKMIHHPEEI
ncbi:MAG: hypothetical protein M0Q37_01485 [Sphaerochaeta sp.]|jgi:hypothetical protein|nr:hypothetical protein [Sphaerochaeta sp.]